MTTVERAVLFDAPRPDGRAGAEFDAVLQDRTRLRSLWAEHRAHVLAEWIATHPGSRPPLWWMFDAPEPLRRRMPKSGFVNNDHRPPNDAAHCAIPLRWLTRDAARELGPAALPYVFNARNPPAYESQAMYLARHCLMVLAERRRLRAADWQPETLTPDVIVR